MRIVKTADCWVVDLLTILVKEGACKSRGEARRLMGQGAVEINGEKVSETKLNVDNNSLLQCGKRFWRRLIMPTLTLEVYD